jgi:hypothetical protein
MPTLRRRLLAEMFYRDRMRRRAYVEGHLRFSDGVEKALRWAGDAASIHVGDTQTVTHNPWLGDLGVTITCASRRSRFYGLPRGVVVCAWLNLSEVLEVERDGGVDGIAVVPAHGRLTRVPSGSGHAPWITAFDAQCLGGNEIERIPEASAPLKATVEGLSDMAVLNQGLIDRRERSAAVQALAYLRAHGVPLDPDGLMVEALRNSWGSTGPEDLRQIAIDLNKSKKLQFTTRTRPERLEEWAQAR